MNKVYLHVQTSNDEALSFYKKQGFTQGELIKDYYKRIEPPDCYIVSKTIRP
jgi:ribosomal protein S18 acetylase RimI-like enzyme